MTLPIKNEYLPANHQDIDNLQDTEPTYPGRPLARKCSLVTGGAGFIGSHVAKELLRLGHRVVVLDDLSGGFTRNIPEDAEFVKGSVSDVNLMEAIFDECAFDYVFHLGAYASEGLSHFIRHFNYENNLVGSINIINECVKHKVKRLVFTSSIAVYGEGQNPMVESMTPMPEDPYGISKYAVELDIKSANKMWGLPYTIFRPHNVYGENQNIADPFRNALGIFMDQIFNGKPLTIFGDGRQTRAFTYIDDVAPYIARSVHNSKCVNEVINIGSDTPYSVLEIAELIKKYMDPKAEIVFLPARNEVKHAYSDHAKFRRIFGEPTETDIETGIQRMVAYAKKIGKVEPKKFKGIEIWDKMPESWKKFAE